MISKKSVFKNIRFAPGSLHIQEANLTLPYTPKTTILNETRKKGGVVLKMPVMKNISLAIGMNPKKKSSFETKKSSSVQGSFKISKTEADITEKQDGTTEKSVRIKVTSASKSTQKWTTLPANLNKITATEGVKTTEKTSKFTVESSSITPRTFQTSTTSQSTTIKLTSPIVSINTESPPFSFNSNIFDKEPWTPLFVNQIKNPDPIQKYNKVKTDTNNNEEVRQPIYTSFTNPSLTISQKKIEPLGVTNLRGHPIPVNKIVDITEPNFVPISYVQEVPPEITTKNIPITEEPALEMNIKETFSSNPMVPKRDDKIKNISAIFHDLVSSIGNYDVKEISKPPNDDIGTYHHIVDDTEDVILGQGQVEVVEGDEETLMKATTKIPLVTLLPVKSNSGIGKPLRRRPFRKNQSETDDGKRSFGDVIPLGDIDIRSDATGKKAKSPIEDFKIVGMLKFAPEIEEGSAAEYVRKAKMETSTTFTEEKFENDFIAYSLNLSTSEHNPLTPEKLKLLAEISKMYNMNDSRSAHESVISTKAVRPTYSVNNFGFKILSKYLNKILVEDKQEPNNETIQSCGKDNIICGDGKCLTKSAKCNHLKECSDGSDEKNCTCADYLRTQYLNKKICDGIIDCWDFSDENNCGKFQNTAIHYMLIIFLNLDWCHPGQYICSNSKACVDKNKICDGIKDCLEGDDERQCVSIGKNLNETQNFLYHNEGKIKIQVNT